jgi:hypothetical protein
LHGRIKIIHVHVDVNLNDHRHFIEGSPYLRILLNMIVFVDVDGSSPS